MHKVSSSGLTMTNATGSGVTPALSVQPAEQADFLKVSIRLCRFRTYGLRASGAVQIGQ